MPKGDQLGPVEVVVAAGKRSTAELRSVDPVPVPAPQGSSPVDAVVGSVGAATAAGAVVETGSFFLRRGGMTNDYAWNVH